LNFVTEHIFPGGQIPKVQWILDAARASGLQTVHVETFGGQHYAKWRANLGRARGHTQDRVLAYEYYMASCEAAFWQNRMQVTHFVFDRLSDVSKLAHEVFGRCE
jgi:cyclopropane fatty-acyl-phospholipid synthase-like methyltransferase